MKLTHNRAIFLMVAVTLMWSTAGVVTRHLESARSFEVTFWRAAFTVLSLGVYLPLSQGRDVFAKMRGAGMAFWLSGVCWSVMFTAFMVALTLTSVGNVLVTMSLGPLLTAVIARLFIGHRIPARTWVAVVVAGAGIVYMYASQIDTLSLWGTLVALCVPIAGATNWTVTQHAHAQGHDVDLMPAVWVGGVLCCAVTLPLALPFQATPHDVALLGVLGVFQLAVPCVLSVRCAQILNAPEISLLQLLEVIFGILLAWWGANEAPGMAVLTGGAVVICALVVNEVIGWRQRT
ncbi:DMT family transporter [Rhodoferax bucti]|uniref:DMT family transporter n=1 Tax=Rhodoferax bucti TaxID=2576305 RepID=UPI001107DE78|nr:DMT family transporter [Rhodoferax bucti]